MTNRGTPVREPDSARELDDQRDDRVTGLVVAVDVTVLSIVLLVVSNRLWAAADLDPASSRLRYRRGFLWARWYTLPVSSVHVATRSRTPAGRRLGVAGVSAFVHDGHRVRLRVVGCPEHVADRLVAAVTAARVPVQPASAAGVLVRCDPIRPSG